MHPLEDGDPRGDDDAAGERRLPIPAEGLGRGDADATGRGAGSDGGVTSRQGREEVKNEK